MLEFYLCIVESLANTQQAAFLAKFNNMVYADTKLSNDEKLFLFNEMQKTWNKCQCNAPLSHKVMDKLHTHIEASNPHLRAR